MWIWQPKIDPFRIKIFIFFPLWNAAYVLVFRSAVLNILSIKHVNCQIMFNIECQYCLSAFGLLGIGHSRLLPFVFKIYVPIVYILKNWKIVNFRRKNILTCCCTLYNIHLSNNTWCFTFLVAVSLMIENMSFWLSWRLIWMA